MKKCITIIAIVAAAALSSCGSTPIETKEFPQSFTKTPSFTFTTTTTVEPATEPEVFEEPEDEEPEDFEDTTKTYTLPKVIIPETTAVITTTTVATTKAIITTEATTIDTAETTTTTTTEPRKDNPEIDYNEYYDMGLANETNDAKYIIDPVDAGAGHKYYQVYYSEDDINWNKGGVYDEYNGQSVHIALDDGRIMAFLFNNAKTGGVPVVNILDYADGNVFVTKIDDYFSDFTCLDESIIDPEDNVKFACYYSGEYDFTFIFYNENDEVIANKNVSLDPDSLTILSTIVDF